MAIAFVQQISTYSGDDLSLTGVGAGNLLVAFVSGTSAPGVGIISGGGTWVTGGSYNAVGSYMRWYYCLSATGGDTVVAMGTEPGDPGWTLIEFSGGTFSYSQITGDSATNTTPELTVVSGELCVGGLGDEGSMEVPSAWGGFTNQDYQASHFHGTASKIMSSGGNQAFSVTRGASGSIVISMITFTASAGGGATSLPPKRRSNTLIRM